MDYYDVVIIGGGIHGAGVAQAASAKGLSVMVLEQADIASGTSSRSSKLIHGGLRYLESGSFSLVRECLHERDLLLKLAPNLVELKPFYIPVFRHTTRRPWMLQIGLSLYAIQGGLNPSVRFRRVPQRLWEQLDGLDTTQLEAVFQYNDAQTDDEALTRAVMRSAEKMGAELKIPAIFTGAQLGQFREHGNIVEYLHNGKSNKCTAAVLVNAAGPWVQQVINRIVPTPSRLEVDLVQGTHIIVSGTLTRGIYYVEAQDKRAVFIMPWRGNTMVGTTESIFQGDPGDVVPLPREQDYLMETLLRYFPKSYSGKQILSAFAGLRVLPLDSKQNLHSTVSISSRSRETILHTHTYKQNYPSLLTIYGGKLTTYRLTAERVISRVMGSLPTRKAVADTRYLELN